MKENEKTENGNEFLETLLGLAQQAMNTPQPPQSFCLNQSRNFNNIKVDVHIVNQPAPGFLRRIFAKIF